MKGHLCGCRNGEIKDREMAGQRGIQQIHVTKAKETGKTVNKNCYMKCSKAK